VPNLTVERSLWIAAPRERVWRAITEPDQIAQWFLPPALGAQLKRGERGKLSVLLGPMEVELADLEFADPPRRLTTRGLPDRLLATTYVLEPERDGTHVTVTMTGFEALPLDAGQERLAPSGRGWEKALANLKAYVEGAALPHPEGFVASLFGYRRETPLKLAVERSLWLAAPRERVWHAITDPRQIEQWFSPGTPWRASALEVGGKLSVYDANTGLDTHTQVIEVLEPPHRLVTRSMVPPPEAPQVTTWTLEEEEGGTRLTLTHSGYEQEPEDARANKMEQNAFGFGMMMENLLAHVEGRALPYPGGF
jgi:uncharacterized protein YndB with AHSA1/START domain